MEREINIYREYDYGGGGSDSAEASDSSSYYLLAKQVNHLLVCFDVYLESESYYLNDNEFQRSKLFTSTVRGRDRRRPYAYSSLMDLFVQRMNFKELEQQE